MPTPHLLTIHAAKDPETDDYPEWDITCLKRTGTCVLWLGCPKCLAATGDTAEQISDEIWETGTAHGEEHQIIDGEPMRPTLSCYMETERDWCEDSITDLIVLGEVVCPGVYLIHHDYTGDRYTSVTLEGDIAKYSDLLTPEQESALLVTLAIS